ncbi:MAG: glycosyltransferase [Dechloromonas sp.]|nr:glycosyltransferase [Dechloromonas sp.]
MKRILVYSHDAYGLGNIRRMLEITNHLVASDTDISVLLISGSPMVHAFRIPARVDYIKLPCVARSEKGEAVVKSLGMSYEDTIRLRTNVIMMAAIDFDPDLVLVDKKPFGISNELECALTMLRKRVNKPKCVLLLRDILDEPETTIAQWDKAKYHQSIGEHFDQVLVVGTEEIFDAPKEYCFPESTARKVRYCGYIERPAPRKSPQQVRDDLGMKDDQPLVLVTAGGGGDGYQMMDTYLRGLVTRPTRSFQTLLISGPEMSPAQREDIFALAERVGGVMVREFSDDMMSCMNAADVVISMGGYNTVCELLTLKKKTIIIPRVEPVAEQWIRAERMERLGLLRAIHPHTLTPELLIAAVEEELSRDNVVNSALYQFKLDGLPRIGAAIAELMAPARAANEILGRKDAKRRERGSRFGPQQHGLPIPATPISASIQAFGRAASA